MTFCDNENYITANLVYLNIARYTQYIKMKDIEQHNSDKHLVEDFLYFRSPATQ